MSFLFCCRSYQDGRDAGHRYAETERRFDDGGSDRERRGSGGYPVDDRPAGHRPPGVGTATGVDGQRDVGVDASPWHRRRVRHDPVAGGRDASGRPDTDPALWQSGGWRGAGRRAWCSRRAAGRGGRSRSRRRRSVSGERSDTDTAEPASRPAAEAEHDARPVRHQPASIVEDVDRRRWRRVDGSSRCRRRRDDNDDGDEATRRRHSRQFVRHRGQQRSGEQRN